MIYNNKKGFGNVSDGLKSMVILFVFFVSVILAVTLINTFKTVLISLPVASTESTSFINTYSTNVYNAFDNGALIVLILLFAISTIMAMRTHLPSRFIPVSIMIGIMFCFVAGIVQYTIVEWVSHVVFASIMGFLPIINFMTNFFLELCIVYTFAMIILLHTKIGGLS